MKVNFDKTRTIFKIEDKYYKIDEDINIIRELPEFNNVNDSFDCEENIYVHNYNLVVRDDEFMKRQLYKETEEGITINTPIGEIKVPENTVHSFPRILIDIDDKLISIKTGSLIKLNREYESIKILNTFIYWNGQFHQLKGVLK